MLNSIFSLGFLTQDFRASIYGSHLSHIFEKPSFSIVKPSFSIEILSFSFEILSFSNWNQNFDLKSLVFLWWNSEFQFILLKNLVFRSKNKVYQNYSTNDFHTNNTLGIFISLIGFFLNICGWILLVQEKVIAILVFNFEHRKKSFVISLIPSIPVILAIPVIPAIPVILVILVIPMILAIPFCHSKFWLLKIAQ